MESPPIFGLSRMESALSALLQLFHGGRAWIPAESPPFTLGTQLVSFPGGPVLDEKFALRNPGICLGVPTCSLPPKIQTKKTPFLKQTALKCNLFPMLFKWIGFFIFIPIKLLRNGKRLRDPNWVSLFCSWRNQDLAKGRKWREATLDNPRWWQSWDYIFWVLGQFDH